MQSTSSRYDSFGAAPFKSMWTHLKANQMEWKKVGIIEEVGSKQTHQINKMKPKSRLFHEPETVAKNIILGIHRIWKQLLYYYIWAFLDCQLNSSHVAARLAPLKYPTPFYSTPSHPLFSNNRIPHIFLNIGTTPLLL